ncbi:MAG: UDP-N-acetylglucosamine acyltransferase, partial [bacterium]
HFTRIGDYVMVGGMTAVDRDVIHFGVVTGTRGVLAGLNLRGLKRQGFDKLRIAKIRDYYSQIFEETEGTLDERITRLIRENADCDDLINWHIFISNSARGMSMPRPS